MKKILVILFCALLVSRYAHADDYEEKVKKMSDEAAKGCATFEDKVRALRHYVHIKMQVPIPAVKPNGDPIDPDEITPLNTIQKLTSGYGGWCYHQATVFTHLARKQGITTRLVLLLNRERTESPHTIAEAFDGKRWVIVDPYFDMELINKDGKMASREDIIKDMDILRNSPTIKELAKKDSRWKNDRFLRMYTNPPTVRKARPGDAI